MLTSAGPTQIVLVQYQYLPQLYLSHLLSNIYNYLPTYLPNYQNSYGLYNLKKLFFRQIIAKIPPPPHLNWVKKETGGWKMRPTLQVTCVNSLSLCPPTLISYIKSLSFRLFIHQEPPFPLSSLSKVKKSKQGRIFTINMSRVGFSAGAVRLESQ